MHALIRTLVATLLALWLAMPSIGGEGGENGGGTGVWILPECQFFSGGDPLANTVHGAPRASHCFNSLNQNLSLNGSVQCGQMVATLVEQVTAVPRSLPVIGRNAIVPASLLQSLRAAGVADAQILMIDASHRGYVINLRLDLAAGTVTLSVY